MRELVSKSFASQAMAFPDKVDAALAEISTVQGAKDLLDKADVMQRYAQRLKAGVEIERPIAIGVLKIKTKLGELLPRGKVGAGRGNKNGTAASPFSKDTVKAYRKLADNRDKFEEYCEECDDVPSQAGFLNWCNAPHSSKNTGVQEWYTPPEYIEAARKVMGAIDLDPATSPAAQKVVKADKFYTAEHNGLVHQWFGRVWMNPPYAKHLVGKFMEKLADSFDAKDIREAITLTNNSTDASWFQRCCDSASALCLIRGRVKFLDASGDPGAPLQGQAVLYFGKRPKTFAKTFRNFGAVWLRS